MTPVFSDPRFLTAMKQDHPKRLQGGDFRGSFLMGVEQIDWPNDLQLIVWSPADRACYQILVRNVLESHFMRTGTGRLEGLADGMPLDDIYVTYGQEHQYWLDRIGAFAEQGFDSGEPPICLELSSPLLANRKRKLLVRDRDTGWLLVCRSVDVQENRSYSGPRPTVHAIPSADEQD